MENLNSLISLLSERTERILENNVVLTPEYMCMVSDLCFAITKLEMIQILKKQYVLKNEFGSTFQHKKQNKKFGEMYDEEKKEMVQ